MTLKESMIEQWKTSFLSARESTVPTGAPLYTYRTTEREFAELESVLTRHLGERLRFSSLGTISKRDTWFSALFVLYSAEWWRRRYDGSGWTWEPIVCGIGIAAEDWNQSQRSECVETGLAQWGIPLSESRGLRFLGSIALQGGLPMQLLAAAQGNIGRVLTRALQLAATSRASEAEIEDWVRSLSGYLPKTYRQTEIFRLLTQVITTVLRLKISSNLSSPEGAIEKLNLHNPNWRQQFPLPIEDAQAQGLIEQLVRDAVNVKPNRPLSLVSVERRLEFLADSWQIRSSVLLPEYMEEADIHSLFGVSDETVLPGRFALRVGAGGRALEMGARRLTGRDTFKITDRRLPEFYGAEAVVEHLITLMSPDGGVRNATIKKGETLNSELPWLFDESDGTSNKFVRQGSGAVPSARGVLCIPSGWRVEPLGESESEEIGALFPLDRALWRFKGSVEVADAAGSVFRARSGQASASEEHFSWTGTRIWNVTFRSPELAFRGVPRLCQIDEDGSEHSTPGPVSWKCGSNRTSSPIGLRGPVEGTWPASGEVKSRSRIVLIPDAREVVSQAGDTPSRGTLQFPQWGLVSASARTPGISASTRQIDSTFVVEVEYDGTGAAPELCEFEVFWKGNPSSAHICLPFPANGARAFDGAGAQLPNNVSLSTAAIFGVRLVGFLGIADKAFLEFTLWDGAAGMSSASTRISPIGGSRVEVRLVDHLARFRRMLASAENLDAFVKVELRVGAAQPACVRIARYACDTLKIPETPPVKLPADVIASQKDIGSAWAMALRLDAPGEEPIQLDYCEAGQPEHGWRFPVEEIEPGPWLIYPKIGSRLLFRPLLWTTRIKETPAIPTCEPATTLSDVMKIGDPEERQRQLDDVVHRLAADFSNTDWRAVEQLVDHLGHLPLCTLDLWKAFSRSPDGIAALSFRTSALPSGFIERFSSEMPAVWESVPLKSWIAAIQAFGEQNRSGTLFAPDLGRKVEEISSVHPSLWALLEVAQSICTGVQTKSVKLAQSGQVNFNDQLFSGENSPWQELLRNTAEANWPNDLNEMLVQARKSGMGQYLRTVDPHFRDTVVNIPILLAASSATGVALDGAFEPGTVRVLRKYQDFHAGWFSEAFNLTVARFVSEKLIQELGGN